MLPFNYSSDKDSWRSQGAALFGIRSHRAGVVPPYDVVVMGASPQGEFRKNLVGYAKLFRNLGKSGTRIFLEDFFYISKGIVIGPCRRTKVIAK